MVPLIVLTRYIIVVQIENTCKNKDEIQNLI